MLGDDDYPSATGSTAEPALAIGLPDLGIGRPGEARSPEHYVLRFISTEIVPLLRSLRNAKLAHHQFTFERTTKRGHLVTRSWFPSYLFLHIDLARDPWHWVYFMPGVISVLGQPRPIAVAPDLMEHLHTTLSVPLQVATPEMRIPPGTMVRIKVGMGAGVEGRVIKCYRRSVDVMGLMFNRPTTINAKMQDVEVVDE